MVDEELNPIELVEQKSPNQIKNSEDLSNSSSSFLSLISKMIQNLGSLSQFSTLLNSMESTPFDEIFPGLLNITSLLHNGFQASRLLLSEITELCEKDISLLIEFLTYLQKQSEQIQSVKNQVNEVLNHLDYESYSYCPDCNLIEKTREFALCGQCNMKLLQGRQIKDYFLGNYLSISLHLPNELIKVLHQRFVSKVEEIHYDIDQVSHKKQLIEIPVDLKLNPGSSYQFFVVDETQSVISAQSENNSKSHFEYNHKADNDVFLCRTCKTPMRFLKTTMYYDTTCDLYKCSTCKMERMTNFQDIWDSTLDEE